MAGLLGNIFPEETPTHSTQVTEILSTLETLHISCQYDCWKLLKTSKDFVGICILHKDGKQLLVDRRMGQRVKSGYIFAENPEHLVKPENPRDPSLHWQTYSILFDNLKDFKGVCIVGFSQKNKMLKGTSGTFNSGNCTNLLSGEKSEKECLFIYRCLIFGAVIMYKLNEFRNTTPYSACACVCLFLILKNNKNNGESDLDKFPILDIDLDNRQVFLKEMLGNFGFGKVILDAAFKPDNDGILEAVLQITKGLKANLNADEFKLFISTLSGVYDDPNSSMGAAMLYVKMELQLEELKLENIAVNRVANVQRNKVKDRIPVLNFAR